jgi:hypothetical protein
MPFWLCIRDALLADVALSTCLCLIWNVGIPWEQHIFPVKILITKMPICHDLFSAWQITTSYEVSDF